MKLKNFLFHRVNPVRDALWDPMDVQLFEKSIRYITKNYAVCTIEDWAQQGTAAVGRTSRSIATISFDDGYKDNLDYAAGILQKYQCPASFYVVTDSIDHNRTTWTHILEYLFQHTHKLELDLPTTALPEALRATRWNNAPERVEYVRRLKPQLKKLTHAQRQEILTAVNLGFDDVELPQLMMNWDDVRELHTAGFVIGSHTATHPMLGTIADPRLVEEELRRSGERIREEVGEFPAAISYPVGSYNQTTMELSQQVGYKLGLAVHQKFHYPERDNLFAIPRTELYNESWLKTLSRINGSLEFIKGLKQLGR